MPANDPLSNFAPRLSTRTRRYVLDQLGGMPDKAPPFRALQRESAERYRDSIILSTPVSEEDTELTWHWLGFYADLISHRQTGDRWSRTDWDKYTLMVDTLHTMLIQARRRERVYAKTKNNVQYTVGWTDIPCVTEGGIILNKSTCVREPLMTMEKAVYIKAPLVTYTELKHAGWDLYTEEEGHLFLAGPRKGEYEPMTIRFPKLYNFLLSSALQRYTWLRAAYHYADRQYPEALRLYQQYRSARSEKYAMRDHEEDWFRLAFSKYALLTDLNNGEGTPTVSVLSDMARTPWEQDIVHRVGGYRL